MSFEEIAAELGWPLTAVMGTYYRAIKKLRYNKEAQELWRALEATHSQRHFMPARRGGRIQAA